MRKMRSFSVTLLFAGFFVMLTGCASTDAFKRRIGPEYVPETISWIKNLESKGESGMWLVTRGYHGTDDLVAVATNAPLSHAAILDLEAGTVIEAIGKGVIETPLEKFLANSHRVLLIKPRGWNTDKGKRALAKGRGQLGQGYDFLGTVGIPKKDRWYCTELAVWTMGLVVDKFGVHRVIRPIDMPKLGDVLFDSQNRDGVPEFSQP